MTTSKPRGTLSSNDVVFSADGGQHAEGGRAFDREDAHEDRRGGDVRSRPQVAHDVIQRHRQRRRQNHRRSLRSPHGNGPLDGQVRTNTDRRLQSAHKNGLVDYQI